MGITHLNEQTFDGAIKSGAALVDFWADWCRPCKMLAPVIEELARRHAGDAAFCKVDVDACSGLASRYGVMSIPTVILFRDGAEVKRFVGLQPESVFEEALASL
jgi:thioredoxin 1